MSDLVLDVGCGFEGYGSVNVDICCGTENVDLDGSVRVSRTRNLFIADGCSLPFRDDTFDLVYSSHVIEHVANPFLFLRELVRVSRDKIVVRCPHRFGDKLYRFLGCFGHKGHRHFFNARWFVEVGERLGCFVKPQYRRFVRFPLLNFVPYELEVFLFKR